jgi:hypothetical protein
MSKILFVYGVKCRNKKMSNFLVVEAPIISSALSLTYLAKPVATTSWLSTLCRSTFLHSATYHSTSLRSTQSNLGQFYADQR